MIAAYPELLKLDARFETRRTDGVTEWYSRRFVKRKTVERDLSRFENLSHEWSMVGINPFHLMHGSNPVRQSDNPDLYDLFAFMLEVKVFTAKDVAEEYRRVNPSVNKTKSLSYAKLICDTLLYKEIVKKEGRGLYCL